MKPLLILMMSFVAFAAIVSGIFLVSNPFGVESLLPLDLLGNTPFRTFRIPGILLILSVGITNLFAVYFILKNTSNAHKWAIAAGFINVGWITMQMILINSANWLSFVNFGCGIFTVLIAYQLKGKWAV